MLLIYNTIVSRMMQRVDNIYIYIYMYTYIHTYIHIYISVVILFYIIYDIMYYIRLQYYTIAYTVLSDKTMMHRVDELRADVAADLPPQVRVLGYRILAH